jgi:hypothetical protein
MAIENPRSTASALGFVAFAVCLVACRRVSGPMPDSDPSADLGIRTANSVPDTSGGSRALETSRAVSEYCPCSADNCPCVAEPNATAPSEGETPARGEVVNLGWTLETDAPTCTEALLCQPAGRLPLGAEHRPLDETHLEKYWRRYIVIRSSLHINGHAINPRIAIAFTSNIGRRHWLSFGPDRYPSIQTEDHVCHPVDRELFSDIAALLDIRSTVVKFSPQYAKYMR